MSSPYMPSPFELGQGIGGNVGGAVSGVFRERADTAALDDILKQAAQSNDPNMQANIMNQILSRVSPDKQQAAMQILQNKMQGMQAQQGSKGIAGITGLPEEYLKNLSPKEREIVLSKFSAQPKTQQNQQKLNYAFNEVENIMKSGYTGPSLKSLSAKGREARAKLNNIGEIFIAELIPIINPRGTMSKERFKYIKSLAPQGSDTDATIRGKLEGLKAIFNMSPDQAASLEDMPENQFKFTLDSLAKQQNVSSGTSNQISDEQIDALLQQTGGDIDAAMQLLQGQ